MDNIAALDQKLAETISLQRLVKSKLLDAGDSLSSTDPKGALLRQLRKRASHLSIADEHAIPSGDTTLNVGASMHDTAEYCEELQLAADVEEQLKAIDAKLALLGESRIDTVKVDEQQIDCETQPNGTADNPFAAGIKAITEAVDKKLSQLSGGQ